MKKICLLLIGLFLITGCAKEEVPFKDVRYQEIDEEGNTAWACITFYGKGSYSLYDCDSEPTSYPFDSEWECTYKYDGENIKFKCNAGKNSSIKVITWDEDTFEFEYENEKKTFKSENWIENNIKEE